MENLIIALVALIGLIILLCFALFFGVLLVINGKPEKEQPKPALPQKEQDPEVIRKAKRMQKEIDNMLSYTGEPQEEITD